MTATTHVWAKHALGHTLAADGRVVASVLLELGDRATLRSASGEVLLAGAAFDTVPVRALARPRS